jgi:hypothetical protein
LKTPKTGRSIAPNQVQIAPRVTLNLSRHKTGPGAVEDCSWALSARGGTPGTHKKKISTLESKRIVSFAKHIEKQDDRARHQITMFATADESSSDFTGVAYVTVA